MRIALTALLVCTAIVGVRATAADDTPPAAPSTATSKLLGHWPLARDGRDVSSAASHARAQGAVEFAETDGIAAVRLNGRDAFLEVPANDALRLGTGDFTVAAWVQTAELGDLPGDILSQYDASSRRGFHLSIKSNIGVASSQANLRHLQFSLDDNRTTAWDDCGRPGEALLAFALVVHKGALYAATCEPAANQAGRVFRYDGASQWVDLCVPTRANAVTSMAVFDDQLYAATGKYRVAGSALAESPNTNLGGQVFRYEGGTTWTDCGQLGDAEAIAGLVEFRGRLYASSLYKPAGFYHYAGARQWETLPTPDGKRVEALGIYNGYLYATSYDGGRVYRFDGQAWADCGQLGGPQENSQTYSFAVHNGRLFVGTWPSGRVYRFEDVDRWTDVGRLGEELEVMGMLVHNGRLWAGTLPLAEMYEYDGLQSWRRLTQLDRTPEVKYRRAWTMAEHQGRVFASTLPSGHVFAAAAGATAAWERTFPEGWQHVAAARTGDRLRLYVGGKQVADAPAPPDWNLATDEPLRIGLGANDYFCGSLREVRLYRGALSAEEIAPLATAAPGE